jgi:O-antigen/teichoic acid export membrane protein
MTLVFFANPLVIGVGNILAPTFSTAVAERGNRSIRRPVIVATLLLSMSLGSMFVVVFLWGNELLVMLFGDRFANYGDVAAIIALGILLRAVGVAPENGLRAMDFPFATFSSQIVTLAVSSCSALLLIPGMGIQGGAYALVLGSALGNIVRWILFWRYSDREVLR